MIVEARRSRLFWIALTAVAPVVWGSNYYVIKHFLPVEYPLWGAALRALPAGIALILVARRMPRGQWWWKATVLGILNFSSFFVLIYVAAQLLPSSIAASLMALSPFALGLLGALLLRRRLGMWTLIGASTGLIGVLLIVGLAAERVDGWGVAASLAAMLVNAVGSILSERWRGDTWIITLTAWQLMVGGLILTAIAAAVEGAPPRLDGGGIFAVLFIALLGTALAFVCWFNGLARLAPGVVGTVGLLNPVTGVIVGASLASEPLTVWQLIGIALVLAGILLGQRRRPGPGDGADGGAAGSGGPGDGGAETRPYPDQLSNSDPAQRAGSRSTAASIRNASPGSDSGRSSARQARSESVA